MGMGLERVKATGEASNCRFHLLVVEGDVGECATGAAVARVCGGSAAGQ